jgi:hypothetical protein
MTNEKGEIEAIDTGFNKIVAFRARHLCGQGVTSLYHILVKM